MLHSFSLVMKIKRLLQIVFIFAIFCLIWIKPLAGSDMPKFVDGYKNGDSTTYQRLIGYADSPSLSKHYDSVIHYASNALRIAYDYKSLVKANNLIARSYFYKGDYVAAKQFWRENRVAAQYASDSNQLGKVLNNIGLTFVYQAEYDSAIYFLKQSQALKGRTDSSCLASTLNNIGLAYMRMEELDKALPYYKSAALLKNIYEKNLSLANTYNNIGIIYKKKSLPDSAIKYYEASLRIALEFDDIQKQAFIYNNLATLYSSKEMYDKAIENAKKSIKLKVDIGNKVGTFNTLNNLANIYLDMQQLSLAHKTLLRAEKIGQQLESNLFSFNHYKTWSTYYETIGQFEQSLKYLRLAMEKQEREINEDKNDKIAKWEARYKTHARESELRQMKLKHEVIEAKNKQKQVQLWLISIIFILFVSGGLLYLKTYRRKKMLELEFQHSQIEGLQSRLTELYAGMPANQLMLNQEQINQKIVDPLSRREYQVLCETLKGLKNIEIARKLSISVNTVKYHLRNVYQKLGVENRKGAFEMLITESK